MQTDFDGYGIHLKFTKPALRRVAQLAAAERTGARGLLTVLEGVLRDFKYELPSTRIRQLEVGLTSPLVPLITRKSPLASYLKLLDRTTELDLTLLTLHLRGLNSYSKYCHAPLVRLPSRPLLLYCSTLTATSG